MADWQRPPEKGDEKGIERQAGAENKSVSGGTVREKG